MTTKFTERQNVWIAMSDLFLDTDVTLHFDYIEGVLAGSCYSVDDLDLILRDEVAPVCLPNLYDIAGEWAGFETTRLVRAIERYLRRPAWARRFGRRRRARQVLEMVSEWSALRDRILSNRAASSPKGNMQT